MTPEQLGEAFAEEAAPLFRELVARELGPLRERLVVLEARHTDLTARLNAKGES